ncbi:MAG TPA: hypothetical protein VFK73_04810 [Paludibacter sp.]|nr:hypothetical protein [Paludibacter sp.]
MKRLMYLFSLVAFALTGCENQMTETVTYKINEPVFMPSSTFRNSVKVSAEPHKITNLGKMCFYNDYLYISEPEKGIHIIDNRNPENPAIVGFIELMGNADLAIRNGLLYADSYIDLVWFDITNPALPELKGRLDSIFPTALPMTENQYGIDYAQCYGEKRQGVVIGWKLTEKTEDVNHYTGGWWRGGMYDDVAVLASGNSSSNSTGINGSMSRFTIYNDHLYSVINNQMNIFDLTGAEPKKAAENTYLWGNVETIFSYKDNMFMGTPTGMLIYSVKDPLKPEYQSSITHAYGCDPVVVDNDLAYVTVHSGNTCGQKTNELFIVDVKDVKNPKQLVSYNMTNPKGLGIDNNKLFLCDDGLQIFNITDPQKLMSNKIAHFMDMAGFDVIAHNNIVMMIAEDGIYQYDYSNTSLIKYLSKIPIGQ